MGKNDTKRTKKNRAHRVGKWNEKKFKKKVEAAFPVYILLFAKRTHTRESTKPWILVSLYTAGTSLSGPELHACVTSLEKKADMKICAAMQPGGECTITSDMSKQSNNIKHEK